MNTENIKVEDEQVKYNKYKGTYEDLVWDVADETLDDIKRISEKLEIVNGQDEMYGLNM